MDLSRRSLLASTTVAAAAALTGCASASKPEVSRSTREAPLLPPLPARGGRKPNPIGISTYSYWRFNDDSKLAIEDCIRHSAEFGFDGCEFFADDG